MKRFIISLFLLLSVGVCPAQEQVDDKTTETLAMSAGVFVYKRLPAMYRAEVSKRFTTAQAELFDDYANANLEQHFLAVWNAYSSVRKKLLLCAGSVIVDLKQNEIDRIDAKYDPLIERITDGIDYYNSLK